jgi:hypothetical protein
LYKSFARREAHWSGSISSGENSSETLCVGFYDWNEIGGILGGFNTERYL